MSTSEASGAIANKSIRPPIAQVDNAFYAVNTLNIATLHNNTRANPAWSLVLAGQPSERAGALRPTFLVGVILQFRKIIFRWSYADIGFFRRDFATEAIAQASNDVDKDSDGEN